MPQARRWRFRPASLSFALVDRVRIVFLMRAPSISPLGALWRGAAAGFAGAAAMNVWFAFMARHMPPPREGAFTPPDELQKTELPTETVARRLVSGMAKRGPIEPRAKKAAGQAIHFGFGAAWGALYGLAAETFPIFRSPIGAATFGAFVWSASDHALLPALRLGPWPSGVTAKGHLFWLATHLVYGAGLGSSYTSIRPKSFAAVALGAVTRKLGLTRGPTFLDRVTNAVIDRLPVSARA